MGTSQWEYETTGVVNAEAEPVMRWWLHHDRFDWYLAQIEAKGAIDLTSEESVVDGTRIRIVQYMDRASWKHHNVMKGPVLPDGLPGRQGDRFVLPHSAVRTYTSPLGGTLTSMCDCRNEFRVRSDATEVKGFHFHTLSGMSGGRRRKKGQSERDADEKAFADTLERCRLALEVPTDSVE